MEKFIIKGGKPLKGEVKISGNKNLATPLIATTTLFEDDIELLNVPNIKDVNVMLEILKKLGADVKKLSQDRIRINCKKIDPKKLDKKLISQLRSSVLLVGPLLARFNYVKISQPGGCKIGARPLTTHIDAFKSLGVKVNETSEFLEFSIPKNFKPKTNTLILNEFSVTATENIIIFLSKFNKKINIKLCAQEPHIQELCKFLTLSGVKIKLNFSNTIEIQGKNKLSPPKKPFKISFDYSEAGTFIVMAALCKGEIILKNIELKYFDVIIEKLKKIGIDIKILNKDSIKVNYSPNLKAFKIQTMPYPGFPTELQPQMGVLATQCQGPSFIHEVLYEGRLKYLEKLNEMGANSILMDPHRAIILGPTPLYGREIPSLDIRSGISFIIAGLIAQGTTTIYDVYQIDRGYEKIDKRLQELGADIKRVKD